MLKIKPRKLRQWMFYFELNWCLYINKISTMQRAIVLTTIVLAVASFQLQAYQDGDIQTCVQ